MPDYRCPKCRGGFPASVGLTADACPWCGESMDGNGDDETPTAALAPPPRQRLPESLTRDRPVGGLSRDDLRDGRPTIDNFPDMDPDVPRGDPL